jgi:hypothetical protein
VADEEVTYAKGLVIIERKWEPTSGRRRRPQHPGWTKHRDTCTFVARSKRAMPAPTVDYPGTVPCELCKPGDDSHLMTFTVVDGRHVASCACGATGTGPNMSAARGKVYTKHNEQNIRAQRNGEPRRTPPRRRNPAGTDKLSFSYRVVDGGIEATCRTCGESAVGGDQTSARVRVWRRHHKRGGAHLPRTETTQERAEDGR